jgi:hypothetical protein
MLNAEEGGGTLCLLKTKGLAPARNSSFTASFEEVDAPSCIGVPPSLLAEQTNTLAPFISNCTNTTRLLMTLILRKLRNGHVMDALWTQYSLFCMTWT